MAKTCMVCDKKPQSAQLVSHANNKTKRWLYPNIQKIRFKYPDSSRVHAGGVCTKCMKKGNIQKVV